MVFGQLEQQLGRYERALAWYERAFEARGFLLLALHVDPQFSIVAHGHTHPITDLPRWQALVRRVGIAPRNDT
jgi:hypothetical protein